MSNQEIDPLPFAKIPGFSPFSKEMSGAITRGWLEYFQRHAARMKVGWNRMGKPVK